MIRTLATRSAAVLLGGASGYGLYTYQTDEGSRRGIEAYLTFVPVILHYRWMEARERYRGHTLTAEDWQALDDRYAVPTVAKLGELQGMYCKYGQTSAGFTNTLGEAWIRELRKLEDQVPPRSVECVLETIQQETGGRLVDLFESVDPVPLGSASIGQVHRAVLRKTGQPVAVKVQYPEAQKLFQGDMRTIRSLCEILAPEQLVMLNALEKENARELDYQNEADNLRRIHANMTRHGFQPREVVVPRPLVDVSTPRMLVMDLLPGVKLIDGIHDYYRRWAEQHGTTMHELEQEARRRIEVDGIPTRYDGPSAWQVGLYRTWLRASNGFCNAGIRLYNGTVGWTTQRPMEYYQTALPPNIPRIVDTLMRVHAYQLFADGFFNAGRYCTGRGF
jgi:aarF domain-containing kinase